ncbi:Inner membrane ABC transporter permease protein YejE [Dickeya solani]|nr:Inner membrane ABC transporter permease protein YejE [Dickeya solani]
MSRLSPINQARWARFRANRRGYWSLWIFLVLFLVTLCSELVANDKPLLVRYDGQWYAPFMVDYSETTFGGQLATPADYRDPWLAQRLEQGGWALWPLIHYRYDTINYATQSAFPSPPSRQNLLGTDSQGRDVLAQVLYGFRISILFGLALTLLSSLIGIMVGASQGITAGVWICGGNALSKSGPVCRRCF